MYEISTNCGLSWIKSHHYQRSRRDAIDERRDETSRSHRDANAEQKRFLAATRTTRNATTEKRVLAATETRICYVKIGNHASRNGKLRALEMKLCASPESGTQSDAKTKKFFEHFFTSTSVSDHSLFNHSIWFSLRGHFSHQLCVRPLARTRPSDFLY